MSDIRGGLRKRTKPFTPTPNTTIDDYTISYRALGILVSLLRKPEGWDVRAEQIASEGKRGDNHNSQREGREAVRSALKELALAGYYRLERIRLTRPGAVGQFVMSTAVSEDPVPAWAEQAKIFDGKAVPLVEQPDGTFLVKYPDGTMHPDDFPPPADVQNRTNSERGFPGSGFPATGDTASGEAASAEASPFKEELPQRGYQDSVHPSDVRPAAAAEDSSSPSVQTALVGEDKNLAPREPSLKDRSMGVARRWMAAWKKRAGKDISGENVQHRISSAVLPHLKVGYTDEQVLNALVYVSRGVPAAGMLEAALIEVEKGWTAPSNWVPGDISHRYRNGGRGGRRGPVVDVNEAWADEAPQYAKAASTGGDW